MPLIKLLCRLVVITILMIPNGFAETAEAHKIKEVAVKKYIRVDVEPKGTIEEKKGSFSFQVGKLIG